MVQPWLAAAVAVPVVVTKGIMSARSRQRKVDSGSESGLEEQGSDANFVCERVCTSDRLIKRMGNLTKDPIRNSCTTVCGTSARDACTEACQRTVCVVSHQVPGWNESCLKRCTAECLKGRAS